MAASNDCQSCRDERSKKGLTPSKVVKLPLAVTADSNFRKKREPVVMCSYCDGETAVSNALKAHKARQAK